MAFHDRIELLFESWGRLVCRRPITIITVVLLATTALIATQLPKLELDMSLEGYLTAQDESKKVYKRFRETFGTDERIVFGLVPEEVFSFEFLETLRSIEEEINETIPYIEETTSIISARQTRGEADQLIVEELLEDWPETEAELAEFKTRVLSNPLYRNMLFSEDESLVIISIETNALASATSIDDAEFDDAGFDNALDDQLQSDTANESIGSHGDLLTSNQIAELVPAIQDLAARHRTPSLEIHVSGAPIRNYSMSSVTVQDMTRFFLVMISIIAVFLVILFRRVSAVIYPSLVVILCVLSGLSCMAWIGIPITGSTQLLPTLLLAVGIGDSIHLLSIFYAELGNGSSRDDAIAFALRHTGLAVFMTSVTTAGSMAAFAAADLKPLIGLGISAPIGVMLAFFFSIVLLPAFLAVTPGMERRRASKPISPVHGYLDQFLIACGNLGSKHPWSVLGATAMILVVAAMGVAQIRFTHDVENWFPEDYPLRITNSLFNEKLRGIYSLEVFLDTHEANGMQDPALLQKLDEATDYAEALQLGEVYVGKAVSLVPIIKEIHQALNENQTEYYKLPTERELIAQELLLFENSGSDDLEDVTDGQFSTGRITLFLPTMDAFYYLPFIDHLKEHFQEKLGDEVEVHFTGIVALLSRTMENIVTSMAKTYLVAFGIIAILMIAVIGEIRGGLVCMIPNLAPIFITVGLMGWVGISFNIATILLGCIAIGIAVDDTIHFMHSFRRYYRRSGDAILAVQETMLTTGRALLVTSMILILGFSVFSLSMLKNIQYFGIVNASAIFFAFFCDVILAPALVILLARFEESRKHAASS